MEQQKKKFGFFKQIATAVAQPKKYERFLHLSTGRVIAFVLIFSLITTFVGYYLPFIVSQVFGESYMDVIDEYVPDFTLKDNVLTLSEPVEYDDGHTLVIANSNIEAFAEEDLDEYTDIYSSVYLIGKTNMIFYSSGQKSTYAYADLTIEELDREGLRAYVPSMYLMMVVSGLMNFVLNLFWYFLGALVLMLLGWSMKSFWNMQFSFLDLFKLGVFSKVLYEIIATVLQIFRFSLPMGFFIGLAIGFVYMNSAVKQLRANGYTSSEASNDRTVFGKSAAPSSKGIYSRASMRITESDVKEMEKASDTENTES